MDGDDLVITIDDPVSEGEVVRVRITNLAGGHPYDYSSTLPGNEDGPNGQTSASGITQFTLGVFEVFLGTDGADSIETGDCDYTIVLGFAGADSISTGSGRVYVYGMAGNDTVYGNAGEDQMDGGGGADTLSGGDDADLLIDHSAGTVDDLNGGAGDDILDCYNGVTDTTADGAAGGSGTDTFYIDDIDLNDAASPEAPDTTQTSGLSLNASLKPATS